jgi:tetratricopeptide (TPR) repeat protein
MSIRLKTVMSMGVSALALSSTPLFAQNVLSRALVVGGADACPAIFVSFNAPLSLSGSSFSGSHQALRIRLSSEAGAFNAASAVEPIETLPNLFIPNIGQVIVALNKSGAETTLLLRFDQALETNVEVVQAGENSIVLSGISLQGSEICGVAATQNPSVLAAGETPAPALATSLDLSDPDQADIANTFADARTAITEQDYPRALQLLTKLTGLPPHARSADAQELLGVVRERNGQFAHAQAEYEIYLETYPGSAGAVRVQQRLAALLTAANTPPELRDAGPGFDGPIDGPLRVSGGRGARGDISFLDAEEEEQKTFAATLSAYYYNNQGTTVFTEFDNNATTTNSDVFDNSLVTSLDISDTIETEAFTLNWRFNGEYQADLIDSTNSKLSISQAYGDFAFNNNLGLRVGRQTRYDGGVFGRFDGALLTWPVRENISAKFTAGLPVNSTSDGLFSSDLFTLGASIDVEDLRPGLDVSAYFIHQTSGSFTNRQAVGLEVQYQNDSISGFAVLDYDLYLGGLNLAKFSGTKIFENQSTLTFSADYARAPLLTLANATTGQDNDADGSTDSLSVLSGFYTLDQIKQFALDRSAATTSLSLAYSVPVNETWMASVNVSAFYTGATPASAGVLAVPSNGVEFYLSAQLVGSSVFSERDVVSISARYADTASSQLVLLDGYRRFQVGENMRVNTRLKLGHRATFSDNGSEWFAVPSVNLTYMQSETVDLEMELGSRLATKNSDTGQEQSSELFLFAGITKQF